jgi:hypothetical protein
VVSEDREKAKNVEDIANASDNFVVFNHAAAFCGPHGSYLNDGKNRKSPFRGNYRFKGSGLKPVDTQLTPAPFLYHQIVTLPGGPPYNPGSSAVLRV